MTSATAAVTPMMAQYLGIKSEHPEALLFYRMGDFYEMFFDDAVAAAGALDIALTRRGKHLDEDIPMCGVPVHSAEGYLLTLIRKGFRVAVCEQLEDPAEARKRGAKSVVERGVVRLVTPGTLTEDSLLTARQNNFLAAHSRIRDEGGLAWVDISTGEFRVTACPLLRLGADLARIAPREVLAAEGHDALVAEIAAEMGIALTPLSRGSFESDGALRRVCESFGVGTLDGFGSFSRAEVSAMGAIVDYLELTQRGKLPLLRPPVREFVDGVMQIDGATRRNLELTRSLSGGRDGSLLAAIDRTLTAAGGRLLERRLNSPSRHKDTILARQAGVAEIVGDARLGEDLRAMLRHVPDIDRALSRLALGRGGPRDLAALRGGLERAGAIADLLPETSPAMSGSAKRALVGHEALVGLLERALVGEPPLLTRDGGFIAEGFDADLDEARRLREKGRGVIAGMQAEFSRQTGISSLKIRHNNVLGYFIETTATHAERMLAKPLCDTFIHRQTTANAVRFTTVALSELETRIHNAGARTLELERTLFADLADTVMQSVGAIGATAAALAEIDLVAALADLARGEDWCAPVIEESRVFEVTAGRHPVVDQALRRQGRGAFIANDCHLSDAGSDAAVWLLTGPNMAGKSTFLRQNALIALLAQVGSFVPAREARIGIVSQLFSRVGAADDLARGRSTFMVEMVETAAILHQADDRALVILDEIGRGTSTYDGLSIAWATLEHLHDVNRCRALFATHYHELTRLADRLDGAQNATVSVKEWRGEVVFLHEVKKGAADRSYGVQVARLAGLPAPVVERACVVLEALERGEREGGGNRAALIDDLPLFSAAAAAPRQAPPSPVLERLAGVHPDDLTPMDALRLIYELKTLTTSASS